MDTDLHPLRKISIHALREEGDPPPALEDVEQAISIHALREEGDCISFRVGFGSKYFYPRPPRGGRHPAAVKSNDNVRFLSTPSARRATLP